MEYYNKTYCLEVGGDYACFTRPEMKVERVSYDIITPSAARGIFQAIFWKPAINWLIKKIEVLNEIRFISVRRNELNVAMSSSSDGIFIDDMQNRAQRAGLLLYDVKYRIHAEMEFIPPDKRPGVTRPVADDLVTEEERVDLKKDENPGKYHGIFERRVKKGQCFTYPYLGCREFSCGYFRLIENPNEGASAIDVTRDLGFMLYDLDFSDASNPQPAFFRAQLNRGVMLVPSWDSAEVRR